MNTLWPLVNLLAFTQFVSCRDFYLGMFRRNDFLVAQDVIYKAPSPFGYTTASYGRLFKCPITYFRVVDRLGMGRGPFTTIVRGGLKKKFINVRIKSTYRLPVSVNIYVGCENKQPSTFRSIRSIATTTGMPKTTPTATTAVESDKSSTDTAIGDKDKNSTDNAIGEKEKSSTETAIGDKEKSSTDTAKEEKEKSSTETAIEEKETNSTDTAIEMNENSTNDTAIVEPPPPET